MHEVSVNRGRIGRIPNNNNNNNNKYLQIFLTKRTVFGASQHQETIQPPKASHKRNLATHKRRRRRAVNQLKQTTRTNEQTDQSRELLSKLKICRALARSLAR